MADNDMAGTGAEIAALTADLLFAARIRGSAPAAATVHTLEKLLSVVGEGTRLVVVDLQARDGLVALEGVRKRAPEAKVVAFAPHVAEDLLSAARAAGADRVMVRGAFVRELPELVKGSA